MPRLIRGFLPLTLQDGQGVIFHFMLLPGGQGDLPIGGVGVAPFGADGDAVGVNLAADQPAGEEGFGTAV